MKKEITRIVICAALLAAAWFVTKNAELPLWAQLLVYLVPYIFIGHDVICEAAEGIAKGNPLDENFLMTAATVGALLIGFIPGAEAEFAEGVFVMLFFKVGELFEDYAGDKSRDSIEELMDIRPDRAEVERSGAVVSVPPQEVETGETIIVRPGGKIALDGIVTEGKSSLDTAALTGESVPRAVKEGDEVVSGCVNLSGLLKVRVTKTFGEGTVAKILRLVGEASANKAGRETFIRRFAKVYTPVVVVLAVFLALVPPFFSGSYTEGLALWGYRALAFLVVSCPCALVLSVPLTFFAGIGGASKRGILIKGGNCMEALAKAGTVAMDKTGTLTEGVFSVNAVHASVVGRDELLRLAAAAERFSTHPVAQALRRECGEETGPGAATDVEEKAGRGVKSVVNGKEVWVGNEKLMQAAGVGVPECRECESHAGTVVHVAADGKYAGHIVVSDRVKAGSAEALRRMKSAGIERTVMLTGDGREAAEAAAEALGIGEYRSGLMPADKVAAVEDLMEEEREKGKKVTVVFVGDGINDAPVLARADAGIAMGGMGSDAAIEAADAVIMDDNPSKIVLAVALSRRTIRIALENTWFAIGVKVAILVLVASGCLGSLAMPMAVFGDVGVMVLAVLNAMRALDTARVKLP